MAERNHSDAPVEQKVHNIWTGEQVLVTVWNDEVEFAWRRDESATWSRPARIKKGA